MQHLSKGLKDGHNIMDTYSHIQCNTMLMNYQLYNIKKYNKIKQEKKLEQNSEIASREDITGLLNRPITYQINFR